MLDDGTPEGATATASPDATSQDPPPGPVEKPSLSPDGPAPDPAPDAGGPESTGAGEPEVAAWATVTDTGELLEHEAVKPRVDERVAAAREDARDAALDESATMGDFLQGQEGSLKSAVGRINAFGDEFDELSGQAGFDDKAMSRLIEKHGLDTHLLAVRGAQERIGDYRGTTRVLTSLLAEAGAEDAVIKRISKRLDRSYSGTKDDALTGDALKALTKAAVAPVREELDAAKATITRLEAEAGNTTRQDKKPPPDIRGGRGGAGRSREDILLDPQNEAERQMGRDIRVRERAG